MKRVWPSSKSTPFANLQSRPSSHVQARQWSNTQNIFDDETDKQPKRRKKNTELKPDEFYSNIRESDCSQCNDASRLVTRHSAISIVCRTRNMSLKRTVGGGKGHEMVVYDFKQTRAYAIQWQSIGMKTKTTHRIDHNSDWFDEFTRPFFLLFSLYREFLLLFSTAKPTPTTCKADNELRVV